MATLKCRVSFGVCLACGNSFTTKGPRAANYCGKDCRPHKGILSVQRYDQEEGGPIQFVPRERKSYETRDGYRMVWNGEKYVREHRLIMEQWLHRKLHANEHIHHINHDKGDNDLDNLIIVSPTNHARIHMAENQQGVDFDF